MSGVLGALIRFGQLLRDRGLQVHGGRLLDVVEALQHVNVGSRAEVYHACRALLVHRREDLAVFDRAFGAFWADHGERLPRGATTPDEPPSGDAGEAADESSALAAVPCAALEGDESAGGARLWSDAQVLAHKDFAVFTPDEVAQARAALDRLEWTIGARRTRRWVAGRGSRVDLRRVLARSARTGGDILTLPRRRRRTRPRPIVLLCDISGSMERYSRMLLHFAHSLTSRHHRVEAFLFSTQITRVTRQLRRRRVDEAVKEVTRAVPDWSGGTRIGEALQQLHQRGMRRALRGGPVVLLISDGWDRGDPAVLKEQMHRLQRSCHRLIWLNPLIGTAGYAPLTRGLQAALPFVSDFLPARTLTNLVDLALHLNALSRR